jgi:aspartate oxidase
MADVHPLADLAPRDIVAKAIMRRMRATGSEHVWLDGRHLGADVWVRRFPTILESCRLRGIDPVTDLIPVAPAQHYVSGGVRTDIDGRSSIRGLYACGEVACTGVHGANRLASNSLLEGLVFSRRIASAVIADGLLLAHPVSQGAPGALIPVHMRRPMQRIMDEDAGVLRSAASLRRAAGWLVDAMQSVPVNVSPTTENWETTNIMTIAQVLVRHALLREETRGSHWREDFTDAEADWQARLLTRMDDTGTLHSSLEPVP